MTEGCQAEPFALMAGETDSELESALDHELTAFNMAATGVTEQQGFSVKITDASGALAAGLTGWAWGVCSGISKVWVRSDSRGAGLGARLLAAAEDQARRRGCNRIFVSSFTFQAPKFYERHGFVEVARVPGLLAEDVADVWLVKRLD